MLPIAFKLITYGTARVKTSEHVNLCISLYTKNCLYHNFLPILAKYFPNCFQISMSTRCLIQWLCEDISVGGGCLRQGYFAYSFLIRVLRVSSPNMTRGDFTQSYLRNHLIKWLVHAWLNFTSTICRLQILSIYIIYIYILHLYTSYIFLYIHRYTVVSEHVNCFIL